MQRNVSKLILLCWLWALALAAAPDLHAWAHGDDAGHDEHDCVAKLIATGTVDLTPIADRLLVAPAEFVAFVLPLRDSQVAASFWLAHPAERGPPAVSGLS